MQSLIILNRNPYDGTDITWNALRLVEQLRKVGVDVRLFLMNDSVDLAREGIASQQYDFNLGEMLQNLINQGFPVKVCSTCLVRCGVGKKSPFSRELLKPRCQSWLSG